MENPFDLQGIQLDLTLYFQRNPFARETTSSLETRLGRPELAISQALQRLVEQSLLERTARGSTVFYRYRRPFLKEGLRL